MPSKYLKCTKKEQLLAKLYWQYNMTSINLYITAVCFIKHPVRHSLIYSDLSAEALLEGEKDAVFFSWSLLWSVFFYNKLQSQCIIYSLIAGCGL